MNSAAEAIERLCDPVHQVSAHYVISESGAVTQLVSDDMRAWHAGQSYWQGCRDMNSASIGIELCNRGITPFQQPQIHALITLLSGVCTRNDIPPNSVIGHSDIALARKRTQGRGLIGAPWPRWGLGSGPMLWRNQAWMQRCLMNTLVELDMILMHPLDNGLRAFRLRIFAPWAQGHCRRG